MGDRLLSIMIDVNKNGGYAHLVSELSKKRLNNFNKALKHNPTLQNSISLCQNLHAKCGYAESKHGNRIAYFGSANLTDPGLDKNIELAFLVKTNTHQILEWTIFSAVKNIIENLYCNSISMRN